MESHDFKSDVIDRSYEIPVLVDFWAPWCGPCRMLGPTLEQLATEQEGRWELVKLNTEDYPEIAQQYRVMSIPNVKLFREGRPVAEFVGALPRKSIEQWLDEHIPSGEKMHLTSILEEEKTIPDPNAIRSLESFLGENPNIQEARVALARHLVFLEPLRALTLVDDIQIGHDLYDEAEDIRTLARFFGHPLKEGKPVEKPLETAREALSGGKMAPGIEKVIEAVVIDRNYDEDLPRKTAIALFHLWGDAHPVTREYRWRFDMSLY